MHTKVGACDLETGRHLPQLADLDFHFIELSKFDNQVIQDTLTQWCLFLKDPNMIIETNNILEKISETTYLSLAELDNILKRK